MTPALAKPFVYPANQSVSKPSEVKTGGTLRMVQLKDFDTYNPFTTQGRPNIPELTDAGGLITADPYTGDYVGYMAESFTISPDKKTFTFKLRKEAKWSDGQPITADDYLTTWKLTQDEKIGASLYAYLIDGNKKPIPMTKVDDYTIKVTFPKASVSNLETISFLRVVPDHVFGPVYKEKGAEGIKAMWDLDTDPSKLVVAGPFKVEKYIKGERLTLTKNKYYGEWNKDSAGKALPYLDNLQYTIIADQNAELAQFLAGNTDIYTPTNRDQLAQVVAATKSGKLKATVLPNVAPRAGSDQMYFNFNKASDPWKQKLFQNVKFRQAMSQLVNRDAMVDLVLGGLGTATYTSVYPVYTDWIAKGVDKYKFNPQAAAKTLAALGFKRGKDGILVDKTGRKLEFTLITNSENTRRQQIAKIFADEAKKIGVKVNTSFIPFNQLLEITDTTTHSKDRKFDVAISGINGGGFVYPVGGETQYVCGGDLHSYNASQTCLPWEKQMLDLYYKGDAEFDIKKRKAIAAQIQQMQAENLGYIYLVGQNQHYAWSDRVQGEFPKKIVSPIWADLYFGPRNLATTWVKQ
nr:ABC transporter substrate-binding protein [Deinobacterium chartae]